MAWWCQTHIVCLLVARPHRSNLKHLQEKPNPMLLLGPMPCTWQNPKQQCHWIACCSTMWPSMICVSMGWLQLTSALAAYFTAIEIECCQGQGPCHRPEFAIICSGFTSVQHSQLCNHWESSWGIRSHFTTASTWIIIWRRFTIIYHQLVMMLDYHNLCSK